MTRLPSSKFLRPFLLFPLWLAASVAHASTLVHQDVASLTRNSDAVVVVRVTAIRARWATPNRLVTVAECEVLERYKGYPAPSLRVVTLGGELGELGQHVAGAAELEVNEEAVLFLSRVSEREEVYEVTGLAQGKWRVERTVAGGTATPQEVEATLIDPVTRRPRATALHRIPLSALREQIFEQVRRRAKP